MPPTCSQALSLASTDLFALDEYEARRPRLLADMLELKRRRRLPLGDEATLVFENRELVLFHLYERMRAEGIGDARRRALVAAEHGALLPAAGELRATLLIDSGDRTRGAILAARLRGPFSPLSLRIGPARVRGDVVAPTPGAVHYLRFELAPVLAALVVAHDTRMAIGLACEVGVLELEFTPVLRCELARDLGRCPKRCRMLRARRPWLRSEAAVLATSAV